jgi:nitric oxide reductase subunit B
MRIPGDVVFTIGALAFTWFVITLWRRPQRDEPLPSGSATAKR